MSISISIGSNPQDIANLQKTKDIISFVVNLLKSEDQEFIFAKSNYTTNEMKNLIKWYGDLLDILYNAGTPEELFPA
jgi:hypothetical protein